ncbi:hypothetical protein F4824DRAFT_476653 [Ustulina deusta]|nr:hypothetical protein F4824DRAFT_476653 [Ustulina deusta]
MRPYFISLATPFCLLQVTTNKRPGQASTRRNIMPNYYLVWLFSSFGWSVGLDAFYFLCSYCILIESKTQTLLAFVYRQDISSLPCVL